MRGTSEVKKGKSRPLFMQLIRRHCVPLHAVAHEPNSTGRANFIGGSALLWETICGRFFVTAAHVWQRLAELTQGTSTERRLITYDVNGPVLIHGPRLVDLSEELDIAVFDVPGINDFNPAGKAFLRTPGWVTAPAKSGETPVGGGYPAAGRKFRNGRWHFEILVWAHLRCTVSESGKSLLLDGHSGKGKATYFSKEKPELALPGISGAPLFALRDTLDWIGIVRSGCGTPLKGYSILATPSGFVGADGHVDK